MYTCMWLYSVRYKDTKRKHITENSSKIFTDLEEKKTILYSTVYIV